MIVDFNGEQVGTTYEISGLRVNRRDELLYQNGSIWSVTGDDNDNSLEVLEFKLH
jgi:hypothetical protein